MLILWCVIFLFSQYLHDLQSLVNTAKYKSFLLSFYVADTLAKDNLLFAMTLKMMRRNQLLDQSSIIVSR